MNEYGCPFPKAKCICEFRTPNNGLLIARASLGKNGGKMALPYPLLTSSQASSAKKNFRIYFNPASTWAMYSRVYVSLRRPVSLFRRMVFKREGKLATEERARRDRERVGELVTHIYAPSCMWVCAARLSRPRSKTCVRGKDTRAQPVSLLSGKCD